MTNIIKNTCWVFGDGVSTDHITPGRFYHMRGDIPALAEHTLEDADPRFAAEAQPGQIIVGGKNFGQGSSREHAALVIKQRGIPVVLAQSFARIFYRNMVNVGIMPIICDTSGFETGDELEIDLAAGSVRNISRNIKLSFSPPPEIMRNILAEGGLVPYLFKFGGLE
ncbi:MAG: 3-isopropylmalate dehydratase small subunit [Anaerolineales bacterium]|nr:3-isopropylmalate dehydratase small subunit [Anaerolineales bacterium]